MNEEKFPKRIKAEHADGVRAIFGGIGKFRIMAWVVGVPCGQEFCENDMRMEIKEQPASWLAAMDKLLKVGMVEDLGSEPRKVGGGTRHLYRRLPHPLWEAIAVGAKCFGLPRVWVSEQDLRFTRRRLVQLEKELDD